jgi:hypothetical protein
VGSGTSSVQAVPVASKAAGVAPEPAVPESTAARAAVRELLVFNGSPPRSRTDGAQASAAAAARLLLSARKEVCIALSTLELVAAQHATARWHWDTHRRQPPASSALWSVPLPSRDPAPGAHGLSPIAALQHCLLAANALADVQALHAHGLGLVGCIERLSAALDAPAAAASASGTAALPPPHQPVLDVLYAGLRAGRRAVATPRKRSAPEAGKRDATRVDVDLTARRLGDGIVAGCVRLLRAGAPELAATAPMPANARLAALCLSDLVTHASEPGCTVALPTESLRPLLNLAAARSVDDPLVLAPTRASALDQLGRLSSAAYALSRGNLAFPPLWFEAETWMGRTLRQLPLDRGDVPPSGVVDNLHVGSWLQSLVGGHAASNGGAHRAMEAVGEWLRAKPWLLDHVPTAGLIKMLWTLAAWGGKHDAAIVDTLTAALAARVAVDPACVPLARAPGVLYSLLLLKRLDAAEGVGMVQALAARCRVAAGLHHHNAFGASTRW